ncbi:MAG: LD-carboxypeptidase [Bdellovibrionales bacterium]|nr:LD-carboxypeptidase [Bdellovibrionales bacterium]
MPVPINTMGVFKKSFENSHSKAVWCLRGGYGSQKLMEWFKDKPSHKKLFIGLSDATAIHLRLNKWGWPSLHGPFVSDIPRLSKKDQENLRQILFGERKEQCFNNLRVFHPSKKKILKAPLIGGNLTVIQTSLGCSWVPGFSSHFLFLEDVNEEAYRLDRALHQLFFAGALKGVKALILGSFHPAKSAQIHKVLNSLSEFLKIPVVTGLPCGHIKNNQPLPFKTACELHFVKNTKACLKVRFPF